MSSMIVLLQCTECEKKIVYSLNFVIILSPHKSYRTWVCINDVYNYFGVNLEDNLDR